jgi:tetratricopeptide (TPR) repeat protein
MRSKPVAKLPNKLQVEVSQLIKKAEQLRLQGNNKEAWNNYVNALNALPKPEVQWEEATQILASLGDLLFVKPDYQRALTAFADAVRCPKGLGNVFIHLRKGQCHFELGDMKRAADDLARAYLLGGRKVFAEEDPKYFQLLERVLQPPKGKDRL